jgi:hypothetical protein
MDSSDAVLDNRFNSGVLCNMLQESVKKIRYRYSQIYKSLMIVY